MRTPFIFQLQPILHYVCGCGFLSLQTEMAVNMTVIWAFYRKQNFSMLLGSIFLICPEVFVICEQLIFKCINNISFQSVRLTLKSQVSFTNLFVSFFVVICNVKNLRQLGI